MSGNINNNLINTHVGGQGITYTQSTEKYYNVFSKKLEEIDIPKIDLEFNSPFIPEKSTFMRTT